MSGFLWLVLLPNMDKHVTNSGDFFYRKSTIGTTKAAIEANNEVYCLRKRTEKFQLYGL